MWLSSVPLSLSPRWGASLLLREYAVEHAWWPTRLREPRSTIRTTWQRLPRISFLTNLIASINSFLTLDIEIVEARVCLGDELTASPVDVHLQCFVRGFEPYDRALQSIDFRGQVSHGLQALLAHLGDEVWDAGHRSEECLHVGRTFVA